MEVLTALADLEKLFSITISFEIFDKIPVVEHFNLSLRQLARTDFKSLHQQRARGNETIWILLKGLYHKRSSSKFALIGQQNNL